MSQSTVPSRILVFGSPQALASPRAKELAKSLQEAGLTFLWADSPQILRAHPEFKKSDIPWAILVATGKVPVPLTAWQAFFVDLPRRPRFAAVVEHDLPEQYIKELKPLPVIKGKERLDELLSVLADHNLAGALVNRNLTLSQTKVNQPELDAPVVLSNDSPPDMAAIVKEKTQVLGRPPPPLPGRAKLPPVPKVEQAVPVPTSDVDDLALAAQVDSADPSLAVSSTSDDKNLDFVNVGGPEDLLAGSSVSMSEPVSSLETMPLSDESYVSQIKIEPYIVDESASQDGPSTKELPLVGLGSPSQLSDIKLGKEEKSVSVLVERTMEHESFASSPVATSDEGDGEIEIQVQDNLEPESESVFTNFAAESSELSSNESDTLKKYASIKERDAREKDAAIQVFKNQVRQLQERLNKSATERRRLNLALEETETRARTLEDLRDSHKHHLSKLEQQHTDELRALQLRLDNTQFQATRAEKKLEDFRERVRKDIIRIRSHERELANKLELQKRDAEALLGAKDERLLQQRREIDRQLYELEILKERMMEETQRAEERASRLMRALKSIKLAQGMLSGMEEEVLPSSFENNPIPLNDEDDLPPESPNDLQVDADEEGDAA